MEKRKFKSLNVTQKLQLLKEVDRGFKKKKEIAAQFGIPASTLSTILKNRSTFQQNVESAHQLNPAKKRFNKWVFEDVDKCMLQWTMSMLNQNVSLTNDMIREKAKFFALSLGHKEFQASLGWLVKFKARHSILQKKKKEKMCDSSQSLPGKSPEIGQSITIDHLVKEVKSECEGNATDADYLDRGCDVILQDSAAIKTEMETFWENNQPGETQPCLVFGTDEAQMALEAIRKYLDSREAVPGNVYDALGVIAEFVMKTEPVW